MNILDDNHKSHRSQTYVLVVYAGKYVKYEKYMFWLFIYKKYIYMPVYNRIRTIRKTVH